MRYRSGKLNADRTLILTDARQALHFKQTEIVGRKASWKKKSKLTSIRIWNDTGHDGKPFKTRTGGTVKLVELLDEAVERAGKLIAERDNDLSEDELKVAHKVGIGAVKYATIKNRTTDFMFFVSILALKVTRHLTFSMLIPV